MQRISARLGNTLKTGTPYQISDSLGGAAAGKEPQYPHSDQRRGDRILPRRIAQIPHEVRTLFRKLAHRTISLTAILSRCTCSSVTEGFKASPDNRFSPVTI